MSTCNCITEKPKQIVEVLNKTSKYHNSITSARLKDAAWTTTADMQIAMKLSTTIELKIKDRKTAKKVPLFFNYCPFCGQEYLTE